MAKQKKKQVKSLNKIDFQVTNNSGLKQQY